MDGITGGREDWEEAGLRVQPGEVEARAMGTERRGRGRETQSETVRGEGKEGREDSAPGLGGWWGRP